MTFIYFYIFNIFYICICILLIYSRAILSFAWLTGYATRPVLLSYTVHTDSFTAHNNNLFINIFQANCYLQVKSKKRTIKTFLQFISIKKEYLQAQFF